MSQSHYETITCLSCQATKKFVVWDVVNAAKDPLLIAPLLSGELTTFRCKKCKTEAPLARDLLYHDTSRGLVIWLKHPKGNSPSIESAAAILLASSASDTTCRLVRSFSELVEKVRLALDGLSDVAMELIKFDWITRLNWTAVKSIVYLGSEFAATGQRIFVLRVEDERGLSEIRLPENETAEILRQHLRAVQAQSTTIGRQWVYVDQAHVAKALGLAAHAIPIQAPPDDSNSIQVFMLGRTPDFSTPHEMDEWVASGALTLQRVVWQIGREVSSNDAQLHRDRKTGHLYVVYRRIGKEWKRHFVARKIFEQLKAKETGE